LGLDLWPAKNNLWKAFQSAPPIAFLLRITGIVGVGVWGFERQCEDAEILVSPGDVWPWWQIFSSCKHY
jgi:hypothetical protein